MKLSQVTNGDPTNVLDQEAAVNLFQELFQKGAIPLGYTREEGMPADWEAAVVETVMSAYVLFSTAGDGAEWSEGDLGDLFQQGRHRGRYPPRRPPRLGLSVHPLSYTPDTLALP